MGPRFHIPVMLSFVCADKCVGMGLLPRIIFQVIDVSSPAAGAKWGIDPVPITTAYAHLQSDRSKCLVCILK